MRNQTIRSRCDRELLAVIVENITRLRRSHGLTKRSLSSVTGISRENMWRYENGYSTPSIIQMALFARTFRVHVIELLLSPEELRRALSDIVCRDGIRMPVGDGSAEMPDFDYGKATSLNMMKRRKSGSGIALKKLEVKMGNVASYSALHRYESGKTPLPTRLVIPVSDALGMTPLELLTPERRLDEVVGVLARKYDVFEMAGVGTVSA